MDSHLASLVKHLKEALIIFRYSNFRSDNILLDMNRS